MISKALFYWWNLCAVTGEAGSENYTCRKHTPRPADTMVIADLGDQDIDCDLCKAEARKVAGNHLETFTRFLPGIDQHIKKFRIETCRELEQRWGPYDKGIPNMIKSAVKKERSAILSFAESLFTTIQGDSDIETAERVMENFDVIKAYKSGIEPYEIAEGLAAKYLEGR